MSWTLVIFDDWQVLYNEEGKKALESERLEASDIIIAIGGKVRFSTEAYDMEAAMEGTPEHLDGFPYYAFTQ